MKGEAVLRWKRAIRRSTLILPVNIPRFVEKAYTRGADAIMLDLEDSIPLREKENARKVVRSSVTVAARGGMDVFVRINKDPEMIPADLQASIYPELSAIVFPKTESAEEVRKLEAAVAALERERGMKEGAVFFDLMIESPLGVLNLPEIVRSSGRIQSLSLGPEDYCRELGVEPSAEGLELQYALAAMVTACKPLGIKPIGLMGSIGEFRDLAKFERTADRARQLGCEGASCIHPEQVKILNRIYSSEPAKVDHARRVVAAFEEGARKGTASVNLDGQMVDIPVYNRALAALAKADAIAELEKRKAEALARLGGA